VCKDKKKSQQPVALTNIEREIRKIKREKGALRKCGRFEDGKDVLFRAGGPKNSTRNKDSQRGEMGAGEEQDKKRWDGTAK